MSDYANQCPGCGNLDTFRHCTYWAYYCHRCEWGFGLKRDEENESPIGAIVSMAEQAGEDK